VREHPSKERVVVERSRERIDGRVTFVRAEGAGRPKVHDARR